MTKKIVANEVSVDVEKVSEVEMAKGVKAMEEVKVDVVLYKHFCSSCGKQYEDSSKNSHICKECKEAKKKSNQKASALSAKKRAKTLGLVGAQIYDEDRNKLKEIAKVKDTTIAEVVKSVLATIKL